MRQQTIFLVILFLFLTTNFAQNEEKWYGITSPGNKPELFPLELADSNDNKHSRLSFSPDGKQIFYSVYVNRKFPQKIFFVEFRDGKWSEPKLAPFSGKYQDGGPMFTPDGERLYFYSRRPKDEGTEEIKNGNFWYVVKTETGWSDPIWGGDNINSENSGMIEHISPDGTMYIKTYDDNRVVRLFKSKFIDNEYEKKELIKILSDSSDFYSPVKFDGEDFFIQNNNIKKGKYYYSYLFISFKDEKGNWTPFTDMGEELNKGEGRFPSFSPDGKYLFFTSYRSGKADFYWIKSDIIEKLRKHVCYR